jgi:hypothetical protein
MAGELKLWYEQGKADGAMERAGLDITYYTKDVWGQELLYPVSKDAIMVCVLMTTKTLTKDAIRVLKNNNATITEVLKPQ